MSVFKDRGMEFDEVRPYTPGDDIRTIDWNVTARTGEPHVKRFIEERELTVMLLVDVSASQDFGSGRRSKLEAAVELSALLAMSATGQNGDKVGLLLFHEAARISTSRRARAASTRCASIREVLARGQANADGASTRARDVARRCRAHGAPVVEEAARSPTRVRRGAAADEPHRRSARASPLRWSSAARCCRGAPCCS